ncbi:class I SAM-dependent methyltransferase, partial [Acinetobacter baumannii]
CGTGLSFDLLQRRIGPAGRIVGIEQSAEMLARARHRVQAEGWRNVELIHAPVEEAAWAGRADAALFVFTHDILQQPSALRRVIGML